MIDPNLLMHQTTNLPATNLPAHQSTNPRLTVEVALWVLVGVGALALRLFQLDAAPLSALEAREGVLAWQAATGQGMPQAGGYSPLLFAVNTLLFTVFAAGDRLARLCPALFGAALALSPLLLRRCIGRMGALAAGLALALSPTTLFASRQLDGTVLAAVGAMALLSGLASRQDACRQDAGGPSEQRTWPILSALGLALAVTASPSAYGFLLPLALSALIARKAQGAGGRMQEAGSETQDAGRMTQDARRKTQHATRNTSRVFRDWLSIPIFLFAALSLSTGLGWNPSGLGAAGDLLWAWITRFGPALGPAASPDAQLAPLALVAMYEPLTLVFGLGGLVWALRRGVPGLRSCARSRFGAWLGLWALLAILLLALMPGRAPLDVLWLVLPLALLSGLAVEALAQGLRERGEWLSEGLYVPVVVVLWSYLYLMLAHYTVYGEASDLALAVLVVSLQLVLAAIFALAMRLDAAVRAMAVATGVVLLALTCSVGVGLAYVRPADPREPLVRAPTAEGVRDLVSTLRDLSWRETGIPAALPVTVLETQPASLPWALAWYLREFAAATNLPTTNLPTTNLPTTDLPFLITAHSSLEEPSLPEPLRGDPYVGQDFVLQHSWDRAQVACVWQWPLQCRGLANWLLFRASPALPVVEQRAALWLLDASTGE